MVLPALELRRLEPIGMPWIENIILYSTQGDREFFDEGYPRGKDYQGWPIDPEASPNPLEEKWKSIIARFKNSYSENSIQALIKGINDADLAGKTILVDDLRIQKLLKDIGGVDINFCFRSELFNEIRMAKTKNELDIMRTAAVINEESMLSAIDYMSEGVTWEELETHYMTEMAKKGGRGVYMM